MERTNSDNFDLYVKLVGPGGPVRLTTDAAEDKWPAWSPDGRWIAFERFAGGDAMVLVMPAIGGPEHEVTHLGIGDLSWAGLPSISWSADGKSLFAADRPPGARGTVITRISVESGDKVRITAPPGAERTDGNPVVSPDGAKLAFTRGAGGWRRNIYVLSLQANALEQTVQRVTSDTNVKSLAWTPDGRRLVFSATRGSGSALWQVQADGGSLPQLLTGGGENSHEVAISAQGRLAYSTRVAAPHLRRLSIGGNAHDPDAPFLTSTRSDVFPQYSPDGKRLAFESARWGTDEIWVSDAVGSAPVQLTFLPATSGTPRWSPDGDKIAFDNNSTGRFEIFIVGSHGGKPVQLTSGSGAGVPSWSRDGKWIYFSSDPTGRGEIWRIPVAGGRAAQVTRNGGSVAFEAAGGQELYFTKMPTTMTANENSLWRMALPDGQEERAAGPLAARNFEPGARGVYFIQEAPEGATLKFVPYGSRSATDIAPLGRGRFWGLSVSPDERAAVYSRVDVIGAELMLVERFGPKHVP